VEKKIRISVLSFFMWILMLLQVKFFWLIPTNIFYSINSNQQQILMVCVLFVAIIYYKTRPLTYGVKSTKLYIYFFVLYYFVELLVSSVRNGQGIVNAFIASNFYLIILLYFFLIYFLQRKSIDEFYDIIVVISAINIIVCWLQYIFARKGIIFTKIDLSTLRFGTLRIGAIAETVTSLGIYIAMSRFLNKNKKNFYYFMVFILGILGHLFVSKGRMSIFALIFGCIVYFLSKYKKYAKKILTFIFVLSIITMLFFSSSIGNIYIKSLTDKETDTGSIRAREIDYYNSQTLKNPILGVGFIRDIGDEASNMLKGPAHQYSRTDVGIWGLANATGLVGVIWYLLLTINLIKKLIFISKQSIGEDYYILLAYMVFRLIYIPTMIFMNPFSITSEAIIIALIDYVYLRSKKDYV